MVDRTMHQNEPDRKSRLLAYSVVMTVAAIAIGSPAEANVGVPMLMAAWPAMGVLLIPIILLEAAVAVRSLNIEFMEAVQLAGVCNLVSTLIGLPITWFLLLCIQRCAKKGLGAYGLETLRGRILSVTLQSPWLVPYPETELRWMIPAAELFLCVPFFFMSVWSEYVCALWLTQGKHHMQDVLQWSWLANGLSYGTIACIVLVLLLRAFLKHARLAKQANQQSERPVLRIVKDDDLVEE